VEVRIGVTYTPREIELELEDSDANRLQKDVDAAVSTDGGVLWLTDRHGRIVGVPSAKVAYIEINPREERRVGFSPD
jgi:hypothetical protein